MTSSIKCGCLYLHLKQKQNVSMPVAALYQLILLILLDLVSICILSAMKMVG